MKKTFFFLVILINAIPGHSQNLDLIVTSNTDSIACKIDSISSDIIYFTFDSNGHNTRAFIDIESVSEYKLNCINPKSIKRIPNTKFFESKPYYSFKKDHISSLEVNQLNNYYLKAKATKTTGIVMILAGPVCFIGGTLMQFATGDIFGAYISLAGVFSTVAGIPVTIIGSKRKKAILKEYSYRDIPIKAKITPTTIHLTQSNQIATGISFTLSF